MTSYKLVIADIDSTLVTEERILTEHAKDVIEHLHKNGVYFGIASGRSVKMQLIKQAEEWGIDHQFDIVIGMNGSELWDNVHQKFFDFYKLKKEWIKEIVELMAPFNLNPFMYYHDSMLCLRKDTSTVKSSMRNSTPIIVAKQPSDLWQEENAKIMFRMPEEMMPEVEAYVDAHPSDNWKAFKTQTTMLEFADRRISKAVALKHFCKDNSLDLSEVIAFGDMSNDDEMIKAAGMGICMKNGSEETKKIARAVTEYTNDEDGFAHYMEDHFPELIR